MRREVIHCALALAFAIGTTVFAACSFVDAMDALVARHCTPHAEATQ